MLFVAFFWPGHTRTFYILLGLTGCLTRHGSAACMFSLCFVLFACLRSICLLGLLLMQHSRLSNRWPVVSFSSIRPHRFQCNHVVGQTRFGSAGIIATVVVVAIFHLIRDILKRIQRHPIERSKHRLKPDAYKRKCVNRKLPAKMLAAELVLGPYSRSREYTLETVSMPCTYRSKPGNKTFFEDLSNTSCVDAVLARCFLYRAVASSKHRAERDEPRITQNA